VDPTDDRAVPLKTLLRWSESLSGIARTGLGFTESLYERERFEEILKVAADIRAEVDGDSDGENADGLVQDWMDTVGKGVPGYVTPKVAVGAIVGNEKGELLLIQRGDSGVWLYPTGWADVGTRRPPIRVCQYTRSLRQTLKVIPRSHSSNRV